MENIKEEGLDPPFLLLGFKLLFPLEGGTQTLPIFMLIRAAFAVVMEDKWRCAFLAAVAIPPKSEEGLLYP